MELLEATRLPWAQGVGRSNRPAPTIRINQIGPHCMAFWKDVRKHVRKGVAFGRFYGCLLHLVNHL